MPIGLHGWFFDWLVFRSIAAILWCGVYGTCFHISYIYHMWSSHCLLIQYEIRLLFLSRWNISIHTTNNIKCKISCLLSDFSSSFIVPVSWLLHPFRYLLFDLNLLKRCYCRDNWISYYIWVSDSVVDYINLDRLSRL